MCAQYWSHTTLDDFTLIQFMHFMSCILIKENRRIEDRSDRNA